MSYVSIRNVSKSYGEGAEALPVLRGVNLEIEENEFVAILGFSGSGKTTLISLLAGLTEPDEGEITVGGEKLSGASAERGVVFQNYSLMPWLTVAGNVRLAVDAVHKTLSAKQRQGLVDRYVAMVGLEHARDRRPAELSGGMRQRVNVARALAMKPRILLLDEPFSALDALTRANLQDELEQIWEQEKKTVLLITNDVDEALLLADRIVPLHPGPHATLGPSFKVMLPRPRDRRDVNHNADYIRLRAEVTTYLMETGMMRAGEIEEAALPAAAPRPVKKAARQKAGPRGNVIDIGPALASAAAPPSAVSEAGRPHTVNLDKYVEFFKATKIYPTPTGPLTVVDEFNLDIRKGEFVSLIGHSGCGKSTVLSMAAGLSSISGGGIVLDNSEITGAGPDRGVVFQSPSLFPWLTAYENVALGVDRVYPHIPKAERRDIVSYYLSRVGLGGAMRRRASELSNGMKQRVGIARAFAVSPKLLLLDEPFGMLDSLTRWELQEVLMDVWTRTQVTAICVTHDVDEAILLADRVVMMSNGPNARVGKIMKVDLPRPRTRQALLDHPDYYKYREELLAFLEEHETKKPNAA